MEICWKGVFVSRIGLGSTIAFSNHHINDDTVTGLAMGDGGGSSSSGCCKVNKSDVAGPKPLAAIVTALIIISGLAGFFTAFGIFHPNHALVNRHLKDGYKQEKYITEQILNNIEAKGLREYLEWLSRLPHTAGQSRDEKISLWIRRSFSHFGLDRVTSDTTSALLSFPDEREPNVVQLLDGDDVLFSTDGRAEGVGIGGGAGLGGDGLGDGASPALDSVAISDASGRSLDYTSGFGSSSAVGDGLMFPYHAYSPAGTEEGQLVYVNYAREEDFKKLEDDDLADVRGCIVIARDGKVYRGDKVANAEKYGAKALLLFPDPEEVAPAGDSVMSVYPNSRWLPGNAVRFGSVLKGTGDPRTPGWATIRGGYMLQRENLIGLPKILSQPISYDAARELMAKLSGEDPPRGWRGRLSGVQYKLGGSFQSSGYKVKITTKNRLVEAKVSNVLGVLRGSEEPDRYVILGGHRDAWGFGAMDPSSAIAAIVKVAKAFTDTSKKTGWRPRRTIIFTSWGAEEFGQVGSTEWVERHLPQIASRVVAVINSEACVSGPDLEAEISAPHLAAVLVEAMKGVQSPDKENNDEITKKKSYYEYWKGMSGGGGGIGGEFGDYGDDFDSIGGGGGQTGNTYSSLFKELRGDSDHAPFAFRAGIPAINLRFNNKRFRNLGEEFPVKHTVYDHFQYYSRMIDPKFTLLETCAKIMAHTVRQLSDSALLPHDFDTQARSLQKSFYSFKRSELITAEMKSEQNITIEALEFAVAKFAAQAQNFTDTLKHDFPRVSSDPILLRATNDQIQGVQRLLVLSQGLPLQGGAHRRGIFSPTSEDIYGETAFPGIADILSQLNVKDIKDERKLLLFEMFRRHLTDLAVMLMQAADEMRPLDMI